MRFTEDILLSHESAKQAAYSSTFSACGCAACIGKSGPSDVGFGVVDTIPDVPSGIVAPVGGTLDGWISPADDTDLLTINVVAGQTYLIGMNGSGADPLEDSFLVLYNSGGSLVNFDDDGGTGTNSLITFTASYTGVYYASAEAFGGTGQYTVTVKEQGADTVPDTFAGAVTLASNGANVFNFIETSGDIDTYKLTLVAGQFYTFEVAGGADYETDYEAVPTGELDTILALYSADGTLLTAGDDINFPDDISSRIGFLATESGTYYLDVLAYPGQTGGYNLTTEEVDLATLNPLDAIDWGGSRIETNQATVYFAQAGEVYDDVTSLGWNSYEIQQAMLAFEQYEKIINVTVTITNDPTNATFKLVTTDSDEFLGYFYPPDQGEVAGIGVFARNGQGWDEAPGGGLEQGGYGFVTLVHEFGHGFGLAHPHDRGGGSDIMPGVTGPFDSYGVYDLNQGVYTTMSYNSGWATHPDIGPNGFAPNPSVRWGFEGTPMGFDTALLQQKYGANSGFAAGDDTYVLEDRNVSGTFYSAIWDTGGTDAIAYSGGKDAQIDLLAATIDYSPTGGGVVSYVDGVFGGFTIANGVVIENASGDRGDDTLLGNAAANVLSGGNGDDHLDGRGGNDTLNAGTGGDTAYGGEGDDSVNGDNGKDTLYGDGGNDMINGGSDADTLYGGVGNDVIRGDSGNDDIRGDAGDDTLTGGTGIDIFYFDDLFGDDVVTDFNPRQDKLDWSAMGAGFTGVSAGAGGALVGFDDGSSILLQGVALSQLSGNKWFVVAASPNEVFA